MTHQKNDIQTNEDVTTLIVEFYKRVRSDERLAPHFAHVDWEHHTPIIIDFWRMILLGDSNYKGNPFLKHLPLKLSKEDFAQWLFHFKHTVDALFFGEKADEAKMRADSIAHIFQFKLGLD